MIQPYSQMSLLLMQRLRTGVILSAPLHLPAKGYVAMSGDIITRPDAGEVLLASGGYGPGMLLNKQQHSGYRTEPEKELPRPKCQ